MNQVAPRTAWNDRAEVLFLDVREQHEWDAGHIEEAQHLPMSRLRDELDALPRDTTIVAVCRSGARSGAVTTALAGAGFTIVNLAGGMQAWAASGLPFVSADGAPPRVA